MALKIGTYCVHGDDAYSSDTCIRTMLDDGTIVVNSTFYSNTVNRHQRLDAAYWRGKRILELSAVPRSTSATALRQAVARFRAEGRLIFNVSVRAEEEEQAS